MRRHFIMSKVFNVKELKEKHLLIISQENLDVIQEKIGYRFKEQYLLAQAFVRSSFVTENPSYEDNEKLEFIGDRVLDLVVIKKLTELYGYPFEEPFPIWNEVDLLQNKANLKDVRTDKKFLFALSEGEMTEMKKQIVQTRFLSRAIEKLGFEKYIVMGNGDIKNNVQNEPHVKEDLFEAIIGAVAIDSSWDLNVAEQVIEKMLNLEYHLKEGIDDGIDYVTYVQNWHQKEYGTDPDYIFDDEIDEKDDIYFGNIKCKGENTFKCVLFLIRFHEAFYGYGHSKKEAIWLSAKRAYTFLSEKKKGFDDILSIIGDFDEETAVSKLQILQDKKLISGLQYDFREYKTDDNNGNPMWFCRCRIDGIGAMEYGETKKAEAKKAAALSMLQILTEGKDRISEMIEKDNNKFFKRRNSDEH